MIKTIPCSVAFPACGVKTRSRMTSTKTCYNPVPYTDTTYRGDGQRQQSDDTVCPFKVTFSSHQMLGISVKMNKICDKHGRHLPANEAICCCLILCFAINALISSQHAASPILSPHTQTFAVSNIPQHPRHKSSYLFI